MDFFVVKYHDDNVKYYVIAVVIQFLILAVLVI